jgi:hypothetical protein
MGSDSTVCANNGAVKILVDDGANGRQCERWIDVVMHPLLL